MKKCLSNSSDEELVNMVRAGNSNSASAFEELYNRYSPKIYTYCSKVFSNNSELAEDIFQDVFERFYEAVKNKRFDFTNLSGYLLKIARNLSINEKSKVSQNNLSLNGIDLESNDRNYESKEISELIHFGVDSLPDDFREVLIMKEFMDMTYNEISEALEIDMPIVRVRIYRAKQRLKIILEPYFKDFDYNIN